MDHKVPKISIITPSYNQGQYLEETILSVLNQDYPNLEYIIIDGGSSDNSVDIIRRYQQYLTYWVSEPDKGTYDANNKGLELITGDYWCIVNSDDLLLPGALQKVSAAMLSNQDQKWFCGGVHYIDETGEITARLIPVAPEPIDGFTFLQGCWISHPTVFLHKDVIAEVGLFRKWHSLDTNYWLNMEKAGFKPFIIEDFLAALRIHKDCKSANTLKLHEEFVAIYTDFAMQNKLINNRNIRKNLKDHEVYTMRLHFYDKLVNSGKMKAYALLCEIFFRKPVVIFENWFMGAVKRVIFGLPANDPLIEAYGVERKANWNNLG